MTKTEAIVKEKTMVEQLKLMSIEKLCKIWIELDKKEINTEVAKVRGWMMAAMENKNQIAFDEWIESLEDEPTRFFVK
jgi:hypothetical protein